MPFAAAMRVLIVDDQLTSRLLIRGGLQELGVSDIEMAADGEQAFKMLMVKPVHLVISDFNMPKMDGIAFLRAIRAYEPTKKSAFILLTGKGDKELIERAKQHGANNVIVKPFTIPVLKSQIEAIVGKLK
jgi:two-component system chemotaxis response regulator CheY